MSAAQNTEQVSRYQQFCNTEYFMSHAQFSRPEIAAFGLITTTDSLIGSVVAPIFICLDTLTLGQIKVINEYANKFNDYIRANPLVVVSRCFLKTINPNARLIQPNNNVPKISLMLGSNHFVEREIISRICFFVQGVFKILSAPFELAFSPIALLLAVGCLGKNRKFNTWVVDSFINANVVLIALETLRLVVNPHAVYKVERREEPSQGIDLKDMPPAPTDISKEEYQRAVMSQSFQTVLQDLRLAQISDTCDQHGVLTAYFMGAMKGGPTFEAAKEAHVEWSPWISKYGLSNEGTKALTLIYLYFNPPSHEGVPLD